MYDYIAGDQEFDSTAETIQTGMKERPLPLPKIRWKYE